MLPSVVRRHCRFCVLFSFVGCCLDDRSVSGTRVAESSLAVAGSTEGEAVAPEVASTVQKLFDKMTAQEQVKVLTKEL